MLAEENVFFLLLCMNSAVISGDGKHSPYRTLTFESGTTTDNDAAVTVIQLQTICRNVSIILVFAS